MLDMKITLLLAALAAHGEPAHFCNSSLNIPPDVRAQVEAANDRTRAIRDGVVDNTAPPALDVKSATPDQLLRSIDECQRLIEVIENSASRDRRPLSDRDQRRIDAAQESIAVCNVELDSRPSPGRRTTPDEIAAVDADGRIVRHGLGSGQSNSGGLPGRAGLVLPTNCTSAYNALFGRPSVTGWKSSDEFLNACRMRLSDPRLIADAMGTEGVGTGGGFSVPPSFFADILDSGLQASEFARRCRVFPTQTNSLVVPTPNTQDRSGKTVAGLRANWTGEAVTQTAQKLLWRSLEIRAHKLFLLSAASNELRDDGMNFSVQLQSAMAASFAYELDDVVVRGSGVGQPIGILNSDAALKVAPVSGQATSTITFENLAAMFCRLTPSAQRRAVWYIAPSTLLQLIMMKHPDSDHPVLLSGGPNDAASGQPARTIFGAPCVVSELCSPLGDAGDIIVGDLSEYALLVRQNARIEYSDQVGFDADISHWRMISRVGGQMLNSSPITLRGIGEPTLSPIVYLAERS